MLTPQAVAPGTVYLWERQRTGGSVPPAHSYPSGQIKHKLSLSQYSPGEHDETSSLRVWDP